MSPGIECQKKLQLLRFFVILLSSVFLLLDKIVFLLFLPFPSQLLGSICHSSPSLMHVYLSKCSLNAKKFLTIMEGLLQNTWDVEHVLDFSHNHDLGAAAANGLRDLMLLYPPSRSIGSLLINDCNLGDEGVSAICDCARSMETLKILALSRNVSDGMFSSATAAGEALGELVEHHPALEVLEMEGSSSMGIGKEGALPLLEALINNRALIKLNLSKNRLDDDCFAALAMAIEVFFFFFLAFLFYCSEKRRASISRN
jgi:hypothetical protein